MSSVSRPDYDSAVSLTSVRTLRIATYNVHRCRGLDGRTRPERIADVLRSVEADVVALQEVIGPGPHGGGQLEALGAALGMGWVMSAFALNRASAGPPPSVGGGWVGWAVFATPITPRE